MSNIIVRNDKENILKTAVSDPTMSRNARGMLLDLLYMDSNASVKALTDMSSDGQYKVSSALKELESKGYLACNRTRVNGKLADSNYVLTTPLFNHNVQMSDNTWVHNSNGDLICNHCGAKVSMGLLFIELNKCGLPKYCPKCGKKIDYLKLKLT